MAQNDQKIDELAVDFDVLAIKCDLCPARLDLTIGFTDIDRRDTAAKSFVQAHKQHQLCYEVVLRNPVEYAGFKAELELRGGLRQ